MTGRPFDMANRCRRPPASTSSSRPRPGKSRGASTSSSPKPKATRSIAPWILGGAALVGIAFGTIAGIVAFGEHGAAESICKTNACAQPAIDHENDANTAASVANVGFIAGAVLSAAAVVVYILGF